MGTNSKNKIDKYKKGRKKTVKEIEEKNKKKLRHKEQR